MRIAETEQRTYEDMWSVSNYGVHSPGEKVARVFAEMCPLMAERPTSVLDAGCGSGKGAVALFGLGYDVTLCDITPNGLTAEARAAGPFVETNLWTPLPFSGKFDYVYCCDVLEHIPTEFTMLTIARLLEVTGRRAFFSICLVEDSYGAFIGTALHQTVRPFVWWRDRLAEMAHLVDARDLGLNALYTVEL